MNLARRGTKTACGGPKYVVLLHALRVIAILFTVPIGSVGLAQWDTIRFDHLLFFVPDPSLEQALTQELFQPATKLSTIHSEQGTEGHYVLFLNTFIEFLYLNDSARAAKNEARFGSPYTLRWQPGANDIAFGLVAEPFDSIQVGFLRYQSPDRPDDAPYLMAEGNTDPGQPMIYVSTPERGHKTLGSLEDVSQADPMIQEDLRHYLDHPSGILRLTRLVLTVPEVAMASGNTDLLQQLSLVEVQAGLGFTLTLEFDHAVQGREFRWNDGVELTIRY